MTDDPPDYARTRDDSDLYATSSADIEAGLSESAGRIAARITEECVAAVLPRMSERPMSDTTWDFIMFRLTFDGRRIDRLYRRGARR